MLYRVQVYVKRKWRPLPRGADFEDLRDATWALAGYGESHPGVRHRILHLSESQEAR